MILAILVILAILDWWCDIYRYICRPVFLKLFYSMALFSLSMHHFRLQAW